MLNRLLSGMLLGVLINAFGMPPAHALEFEQKGNIVLVTGADIDFVDVGRFEAAFAKGANTVVFSKIGGSRIDVLSGIGRLIQKNGVTTVATDWCGASCAYLFMAGKQRRYGTLPGKPAQTPVFLSLAGSRFEGSNQAAHNTSTYTYFKNAFGDGMPHDLLNKYTSSGEIGQYVVFTRPSKSFPEGQVVECVAKDGKKTSECQPVEGLTPVRAGALTSAEPFDLSGNTTLLPAPSATADSGNMGGTPPANAILVTEKNLASLIVARRMSREEGAEGIGNIFSNDGKLVLVMTYQWDADRIGGPHSTQVKWYRNGQMIKTDRINSDWKKPPFVQWIDLPAVSLGIGEISAEVLVDDRPIGEKKFTIRTN